MIEETDMLLIRKNNGYILITSLLLLLVLTVLGLSAIGTSTIENMLSGNIRLRETNISRADSGVEISTAIVERAVRVQNVDGFTNIVKDPNLPVELRSSSFDSDGNTDVSFNIVKDPNLPVELRSSSFDSDGNTDVSFNTVAVDIDRMYSKWIGGTAIEFASGYEGAGKSGGSGFYTYYRINSTGTGPALTASTADVGAIYRYVPK
jgi:Tfp pilus assembly protein PilX